MMQVVNEGIVFFPLALNVLDSATQKGREKCLQCLQGKVWWNGPSASLITHLYGSSDQVSLVFSNLFSTPELGVGKKWADS